jgi:hypothetical protein
MKDDLNGCIIKGILMPVIGILLIGGIINQIIQYEAPTKYKWVSSEENAQRQRDAQDKWYQDRGIDNTLKVNQKGVKEPYHDYETEEIHSDLFKEFMEEIDEKGVELGSPESMEIWDTYYK